MEIIRNGNGLSFANYDGSGFVPADWDYLRSEMLGLNVIGLPPGEHGLEALKPAYGWLRSLRVNSASCTDLRLVRELKDLDSLAIGGLVEHGLPASDLPGLESFSGPIDNFPGIEHLPSLRSLGVVWASHKIRTITAPLRQLAYTEKARQAGLPALAHPELLESLEVDFAKNLDVSTIGTYRNLRELTFHHCRVITGARSLCDLALDTLVIENCPDMEGYESLTTLSVARAHVVGRNPFGARFREEVAARVDCEWTFPPSTRYLSATY